jgi:hypothetical protein
MGSNEFDIKLITESMVQIHNLCTEFVRTARFYAELLVKEKFNLNKSVKVINVGGIAGKFYRRSRIPKRFFDPPNFLT